MYQYRKNYYSQTQLSNQQQAVWSMRLNYSKLSNTASPCANYGMNLQSVMIYGQEP